MSVSRTSWEKLLLRWCGLDPTGEVRLVCAVLSDGIVDRNNCQWFFRSDGGFDTYCRALGLDPVFVRQQIDRANVYQPQAEGIA